MKIKKRIKSIFILIILAVVCCFGNSTYAVNLKFSATFRDSNIDTRKDKTMYIRMYCKRYLELDTSDWVYYSQSRTGGYGYYQNYGISFWGNKKSANYIDSGSGSTSRYDTYIGDIDATSDNAVSYIPTYNISNLKYVTATGENFDFSYELNGNEPEIFKNNFNIYKDTIKFYRYRAMTYKVDASHSVAIEDFAITPNGINDIISYYYSGENKNNRTYVDEATGCLKIGFGINLHTYWPYGNNERKLTTGKEAHDVVHTRNSSGNPWSPYNWGNDWNGNATTGTSILNFYDNWIYIPISEINPRTVIIKYKVKNSEGIWEEKKVETKEIGPEAQSIAKGTIDENTDKYYIGGKMVVASTKEEAEKDISNSTNSWGWDTTSINIPESTEEEYYVVELYYDYRKFEEKHLTVSGQVIDSTRNKTLIKCTYEEVPFKAIEPFYHNYEKYAFVKTKVDETESTAKSVRFEPLNGADDLIFGDEHDVNFYYEYEPPRKVYVRHFVYDDDSGLYQRLSTLTNSSAAIKDVDDGKYYLRPNGYNQRHFKCGDTNYRYISDEYNEQYVIDFGDTIKLDKSRTIEDEGIKYNYKGAIIKNDASPDVLLTKSQADTIANINAVIELTPSRVERTYVDFYYIKENITPPGGKNPPPGTDPTKPGDPDDPTLDFIPQDDSEKELVELTDIGSTDKCKIVYVPSGENLKAMITTSTYRPYSLIYESDTIDQTSGKITYKLKKYDAYKFIDGAVQNTDVSVSNYGYINSVSKKGVFNTENDTFVNPIEQRINDAVNDSISTFASLDPNTITIVEDGRKTTKDDFGSDNVHKVNYDKYNGIRKPSGIANYNVVSLVVDGIKVSAIEKLSSVPVITRNNAQVNVYTPAKVEDVIVESTNVVNHSNHDSFVIQKGAAFKVTPVSGAATKYKNISDTSKYIKYYWLVLDFDAKLVQNEKIFDKDTKQIITMNTDQIVRAGNLIQIPVGATFSAIATNDSDSGDIINQFSNKLKVVAVTYNATDDIFENRISETIKAATASSYVDKNEINKVDSICGTPSNKQTHIDLNETVNLDVTKMYDDAKYFVEYTKSSKNIGRIYDFKVTDCLDVNFKNVFRVSENGNVNDLRGIKYFSGVRKLLVYGGAGVQLGANPNNTNNIFAERVDSDSSINAVVSKTILPLGPYKHIEQNYVQAPKLGYRISFDVKTSGTYKKNINANSSTRSIRITPSYYYISKDGKIFDNNIDLYYKNSSGKYVNFAGSGYSIYFKPNDGYRTTYNPEAAELKDMSTKMESLKIGGQTKNGTVDASFELTDNMMSYSDNNFVQAWYGEFKLPNSIIAVKKGENIKNQLADGYIGVVFKIECVDKESKNATEETIVSYSNEDKSYAGTPVNTTQWDYEGYLGFSKSNIGTNLNGELRIQLEKDYWVINTQELYSKVKGTVVLFDIDNRAANDFE